jgi:site-specific DNA recombinase
MARARTTPGVGYARYSKLGRRDAESLRTLDAQDARNEDVAADNGVELVASFEDHGKSGATNDRHGLESALELIESGDAKVLVAARLSRLARSIPGLRDIIRRVDDAGGTIVLGDLGRIDSKTAAGSLLVTVLGAVAEFELDLAREHGEDARANAIASGTAIMSIPPWGYQRPAKTLEVDPVRGPIVTELFARRANGAPWSELSAYVHEQTGDFLQAATLGRMIANVSYLGTSRHGRFELEHAHDALVDRETFDAAQAVKRTRAQPKHDSLLAGLLTCESCGKPMTHRVMRQTKRGDRGFPTYICQRESSAGRCPAPVTVSARLADAAVTESFLDWARRQPTLSGDPSDAVELAQAEAALAEAELEQREWISTARVLARTIDERALESEAAVVQQRVDDARARLAELRSERRLERVSTDAVALFTAPETTNEQRRKLLAAALERVVVRRSTTRAKGVPFTERADVVWRDA